MHNSAGDHSYTISWSWIAAAAAGLILTVAVLIAPHVLMRDSALVYLQNIGVKGVLHSTRIPCHGFFDAGYVVLYTGDRTGKLCRPTARPCGALLSCEIRLA
jgi:hypothetical protein